MYFRPEWLDALGAEEHLKARAGTSSGSQKTGILEPRIV
jgi:hypothetical protein